MRIKARVLKVKDMQVLMECNGKTPKVGDIVTLRWGKVRSNSQNSIYWCWLTWVIENGGQDQGYMDTEELHEVLKARFLSKRIEAKGGIKTIKVGSTTELSTDEFVAYMDKCEHTVLEYLGISSAGFYAEYAELKGGE